MSIVAITGAGGYIGQQLIAYLEKALWCERIIGTDIVAPVVQSSKLYFEKQDIRDPKLAALWQDHKVDTVVHLAFVLNPIHDEQKMFDINVNGCLNVLQAGAALNIAHIIVASSGSAYGAWPDNPPALKESDPIRLFPSTFSYAHHKGIIEGHCAAYLKRHPGTILNVVRPCIVYGPHADNFLTRFLDNLPVLMLADGCDPGIRRFLPRTLAAPEGARILDLPQYAQHGHRYAPVRGRHALAGRDCGTAAACRSCCKESGP